MSVAEVSPEVSPAVGIVAETRPHWVPAYIGLGSNLDDPARQVQRAIDELRTLATVRVVAESALYGNPPMGPQDQPDYVNAAVGLLAQQSLYHKIFVWHKR